MVNINFLAFYVFFEQIEKVSSLFSSWGLIPPIFVLVGLYGVISQVKKRRLVTSI